MMRETSLRGNSEGPQSNLPNPIPSLWEQLIRAHSRGCPVAWIGRHRPDIGGERAALDLSFGEQEELGGLLGGKSGQFYLAIYTYSRLGIDC